MCVPSGAAAFSSPANTSRMSLNSSIQVPTTFPCIQLLGLEMLLHYFLGPEAVAVAMKNKFVLSLGESRGGSRPVSAGSDREPD